MDPVFHHRRDPGSPRRPRCSPLSHMSSAVFHMAVCWAQHFFCCSPHCRRHHHLGVLGLAGHSYADDTGCIYVTCRHFVGCRANNRYSVSFLLHVFLIPCGRPSWLSVIFYCTLNTQYRIVSYRMMPSTHGWHKIFSS